MNDPARYVWKLMPDGCIEGEWDTTREDYTGRFRAPVIGGEYAGEVLHWGRRTAPTAHQVVAWLEAFADDAEDHDAIMTAHDARAAILAITRYHPEYVYEDDHE